MTFWSLAQPKSQLHKPGVHPSDALWFSLHLQDGRSIMAYEINTGVGWLVLELVTETAIVNIGIGVQILASFR